MGITSGYLLKEESLLSGNVLRSKSNLAGIHSNKGSKSLDMVSTVTRQVVDGKFEYKHEIHYEISGTGNNDVIIKDTLTGAVEAYNAWVRRPAAA